jgi:hypothetical protein
VLFYLLNVAARKFMVICVAFIFLLNSTAIESWFCYPSDGLVSDEYPQQLLLKKEKIQFGWKVW